MKSFTFRNYLYASALLLLIEPTAHATALYVNCGGRGGSGAFTSISAALKAVRTSEGSGSSTINVSGACNENVLIKDTDRLVIVGTNGASVTDASGGTRDVFEIRNSRVTISGMTIDGLSTNNYDDVDCWQGSSCMLIGNTIQGGADGVAVYALSRGIVVGGSIRNTTSAGLRARGDVSATGVMIQSNPTGALVLRGGRLTVGVADPAYDAVPAVTAMIIAGNGSGVIVTEGSEFVCQGCVIEDNSGDGIHADVSAATTVQPSDLSNGSVVLPSITRNAGYGVYVGDLSSAAFHGPAVLVTGNGQSDVFCASALSVSRGALSAAGGPAHTNCSN